MFMLLSERITKRHLEYLEMFRGRRAQILLYATLFELIISKVFARNRETDFQSKYPYLPSNV